MDKCPNCGNKVSRMDVLCPRCGAVVEDIKAKSSAKFTTAPDSVSPQAPAVKKSFPQSFIVYNEDFPDENEMFSGGKSYENKTPDPTGAQGNTDIERDSLHLQGDDVDLYFSKQPKEKAADPGEAGEQAQAQEDGDTYSERYLNRIRENPLPEIEDINRFNPEGFIRKYRQSKDEFSNIPVGFFPEEDEIVEARQAELKQSGMNPFATRQPEIKPADIKPAEVKPAETKRWLEIEEVTPQSGPSDGLYNAAPPPANTQPAADRAGQYNAAPPSVNTQTANGSEVQERRYRSREKTPREITRAEKAKPAAKPEAKKERRKVPAVLQVFIWIFVAAALFAGFFLFDRFVTTTYGSYDSLIYSITGGRINTGGPAAK